MVNDAVGSGPGDAEQRGELTRRQVRAAVRRDQQCPVCWRQAPRPARRVASPPRDAAPSPVMNWRGLSPENGTIQNGSDAVITPATSRSFHRG